MGYNTSRRGKKAYRPILCFVYEAREYFLSKVRKGDMLDGEECAVCVSQIKKHLPGGVKKVLLQADAGLLSRESVLADTQELLQLIIGNKVGKLFCDPKAWYQPRRRNPIHYNRCVYQLLGWKFAWRFVEMRIPKKHSSSPSQRFQGKFFEEDRYTYRFFCINLKKKTYKVIANYEKKADAENLIGEAKRESLDAIPSAKLKNNYAYFQVVMLAYNFWRYCKILGQKSTQEVASEKPNLFEEIQDAIRIGRLNLLLIAGKLLFHNNREQVKFFINDSTHSSMQYFLKFSDKAREKTRPWIQKSLWPSRFSVNFS